MIGVFLCLYFCKTLQILKSGIGRVRLKPSDLESDNCTKVVWFGGSNPPSLTYLGAIQWRGYLPWKEGYCRFDPYHLDLLFFEVLVLIRVIEESGLSRHIWDVEHVGSNPTYPTWDLLKFLFFDYLYLNL